MAERAEAHSDLIAKLVVVVLVAALFGWSFINSQQLAEANRESAALAQQVRELGGTPIAGSPGASGNTGPKGDRGDKGDPGASPPCLFAPTQCVGAPGSDSAIPGPAGDNGKNGLNGSNGADSTVPGPPGNDSTVPGPQGDTGPPGTLPPSYQTRHDDGSVETCTLQPDGSYDCTTTTPPTTTTTTLLPVP